MTAKTKKRLLPARPDVDEGAGYMPRLPWRMLMIGAMSLATVIGGYKWKEARKADQLRMSIVHVHQEELGEARKAVTALRDKIEGLVLSASQAPTETQRDPHLHIPGLRSGNGLYLRLSLEDAKSQRGIIQGAKTMEADLIAQCMGLSPTSVRGLYEKGEFLMPPWIAEVKKLSDVMSLRVQDEVLSRRIHADLPSVLGLVRANWLLLVLEEGPNRRDFPVRVFLWGLRDSQLLLRARVQSVGTLITARLLSKGVPTAPRLSEEDKARSGASDCSIASQLKTLSAPPAKPAEAAPTAPETPAESAPIAPQP